MSLKENELRRLELLGQRLSTLKPKLKDYACNDNAPKLLAIDIMLMEFYPKSEKRKRKVLETVRRILLYQGEGLWVHNADALTQLAIKVGSNIEVVDF